MLYPLTNILIMKYKKRVNNPNPKYIYLFFLDPELFNNLLGKLNGV